MEKLIYKKMINIQDEIEAIHKKKTITVGSGYKYRGVEDVLDEVAPAMRKHKVFLRPKTHSIVYNRYDVEKFNANGAVVGKRQDTSCMLQMSYFFVAEDGSEIEIGPISGEGIDSGDKATAKATSVCYKLAMISTFSIPVNDMPEIEDAKTDLRDTPVISNKKPVQKETLDSIKECCATLTKGMTKEQKSAFQTTELKVNSFSDLSKHDQECLENLLVNLQAKVAASETKL